MGRTRQATGDRLERTIEAIATLYRRTTWGGLTTYRPRRTGDEPPVALLTRPGPKTAGPQGRMKIIGKTTVDFVGQATLFQGGPLLPIAFDCKSVTGASSFGVKPEELHQLGWLLDVQAQGGLGFYLLEDGRENRCWILSDLRPLLAGHRVKFRRLATPKGMAFPKTAADLLPAATHGPLPGIAAIGYDVLALLRIAMQETTSPTEIDDSAIARPRYRLNEGNNG